ncbi:MAG TPA: hypothetical protein VFN78_05930 [Ktedonobacterales bacterium]|nr:hypothetical protein [Ktedonobacterales bacterium]
MGVFFEPSDEPANMQFAIAGAFSRNRDALKDPGAAAEVAAHAAHEARGKGKRFTTRNFLIAAAMFFAIVALGAVTELMGLKASTQALWGLAGSIFGVIVGLLGGEQSA